MEPCGLSMGARGSHVRSLAGSSLGGHTRGRRGVALAAPDALCVRRRPTKAVLPLFWRPNSTLRYSTANRSLFSAERTVFSLVHSHELYYAKELENVPPERMFVQPADRGTLPAILYSLLRLIRGDKRAVAAFFPTDHHFFEEERFLAGMELAFAAAEAHSDTVILMGAPATYAATDYGWIEVEAASSRHSPTSFLRVKNFWEKPARQVAEELLDRGCIWNTFVMVGRA